MLQNKYHAAQENTTNQQEEMSIKNNKKFTKIEYLSIFDDIIRSTFHFVAKHVSAASSATIYKLMPQKAPHKCEAS
ncbi:hypothetical protein RS130_18750 [Paraglaciecola aquimarina]|uniref:Uncharacterized protein n=1 Tax=Paraglaciecola aquimarina TaxID=1235557 RepID=A0ABU3T066_9ALTE|nr:hypothetical protein [Paraglaciecola aquimarina]MDU0355653.1 hypothetical protein [Paraglaciecola aquimarina]